ncbi:hypothetical protein HNV08_05995 [Winogradskyella eckloniae]|uniref:hypothetical protein n=1 Tax=Winogradskyella eckloniae TaxID=1089306 RepID=UPI001566602C|nr:hypothetical protein [Winogradskyella eckloniae]NRD19591.1 hypothetical protein [Winogradskyella eckloniae]
MKLKNIIFAFTLTLFVAQLSWSQTFEVPENVKLEVAEDYVKHEPQIVDCINWLENTPMSEEADKRLMANAYVMKWATGTTTVTISMQSFQVDLTTKNPELLIVFIGGWIKYAIENPDDKDNVEAGNISGINSLIKVYSANKGNGLKKDKRIEKLIKMDASELKNWVAEQLK